MVEKGGHDIEEGRKGEEAELKGIGQMRWRRGTVEQGRRFLIEIAIKKLARILALEKFTEIHKDDPC